MKKTLVLLFLILSTWGAFAQKAEIYSTQSIAINGYDAVAYFRENQPVKGNAKFAYQWKESTWLFSDNENLKQFKNNPEQFAPQYGGYCAYGTSQGYKAPTEPDAFTIVNGKLYLNYNTKVREQWAKDRENLIIKADTNWPDIINKK